MTETVENEAETETNVAEAGAAGDPPKAAEPTAEAGEEPEQGAVGWGVPAVTLSKKELTKIRSNETHYRVVLMNEHREIEPCRVGMVTIDDFSATPNDMVFSRDINLTADLPACTVRGAALLTEDWQTLAASMFAVDLCGGGGRAAQIPAGHLMFSF